MVAVSLAFHPACLSSPLSAANCWVCPSPFLRSNAKSRPPQPQGLSVSVGAEKKRNQDGFSKAFPLAWEKGASVSRSPALLTLEPELE